MDQIFDTDDALLTERPFHHRVVGQRDTRLVNLAISTLQDQFADGFEVGVSIGDIGLYTAEHREGGLVDFEEDAAVDSAEAKELEDFLGLGGDVVQTTDADDEEQLGFRLDIKAALGLGSAAMADEISFLRG